jgi:hypothetical protein
MEDGMKRPERRWLGEADRYARLRKIESLDVTTDYREITLLFYGDFQSAMMAKAFNGFLMTYSGPRISKVLHASTELEKRVAKRVIDTTILASKVLTEGFVGEGRDAARRVNAMHKQYDIETDDYLAVGIEEVVGSIELAERYGWRPVTDKEREAVLRYYSHQTRAFGSPKPLPPTYAEAQAFFSNYLDTEARYEPRNEALAKVFIKFNRSLMPLWLRPVIGPLLSAQLDPRVARACGIKPASRFMKSLADFLLRRAAAADPVPDGAPSQHEALIRTVYPHGYKVSEVGTHVKPSGPEPASAVGAGGKAAAHPMEGLVL